MASDPAFLFYPGDYLRDTQCLSEKTQVSYDRIMCEHMRNICISKQQLKFFTKRLSEDELEELLMVLTEIDGGYQIKWIAESIEKRRAYSESRRNNRKKKSKESNKNICSTYDEHMENEDEIDNKDLIKKEESFSIFWNKYPKKITKQKCIDKWNKLKPIEIETILSTIDSFIKHKPFKEYNHPNPLTYLNQQRWEDVIPEAKDDMSKRVIIPNDGRA